MANDLCNPLEWQCQRTSHAVYELKYHLVWIPKYRKVVLGEPVAQRCKQVFQGIAERYGFAIVEQEVMPDHVHWLFQLQEVQTLVEVMKAFKARSAVKINQYSGRQGSLWQKAYYDHALRKDEDVREIARYIVANPLRAGLVTHIGDYSHWDAIWV